MDRNIRNTNLRFNLNKDLHRKAWDYLKTMDKQEFKSYSHAIALALVKFFDHYYLTLKDSDLESKEREEHFVAQIVKSVENSLLQTLPVFLAGCMVSFPQKRQEINTHFSPESTAQADIDWDFLGE